MVCIIFDKNEKSFNIQIPALSHHCSRILAIILKSEDSKHKKDRITNLTFKLKLCSITRIATKNFHSYL